MNSKLINELAEFSDFHVGNEHYNKSHKEQQRIFMEFFAELIVRECIQRCEGNGEYKNNVDTEWGKGLAAGIDLCKEVIKQHFGVEE